MSDLLSQNEIDALLHGVGDDDSQKSAASEAEDYILYDLTSGMNRVSGWSQEIQAADERMQASLSIKLLGLLHKSVEVKRQDIRIEKYGKYVKSLYVPTSMTTFLLSGMVGFLGYRHWTPSWCLPWSMPSSAAVHAPPRLPVVSLPTPSSE